MALRDFATRLWNRPYLLLSLTILFWAGNSIVARAVRDSIPPMTLTAFRWVGASILVMPFACRPIVRDMPVLRAHWRMVLALGLLGVAAFNTLLYLGVHYTTASNALLIQASMPPIILLMAWLWRGERTTLSRLLATALSFAGVIMVVAQGSIYTLLHMTMNFGDILVLIASVSWAAYTLLLPERPQTHPLTFLAVTFLIGVACVVPLTVLELARGARILWSPAAVGAILYVALLPSVVAYVCYVGGVSLVGAAVGGQFINAMPLVGALLAVLLLGERLVTYHLVGMAMILFGIIWFARATRRPPEAVA
ncbi:MAG: DMT family transporter [Sphingobium sp.]|uniref:DMT family transporter n=1 Tax=Sphingobium sp. TaxID=1912891 RepID=UPI0029A87FAD|nr:DMT family transporter [Sphingobium sp.]MDX3910982.1 DMT family transporter [Sphingobium sp.]